MLDLARDPAWQFIGVLLALAAIFLTYVVYRRQQLRKRLTYDVVSRNQLLTVKEELAGKLSILYEGRPAKAISVLVVRLWNSGNQPIQAADYERPISFLIQEPGTVLSADIIDVYPSSLNPGLAIDENKVHIEPVLLNPDDSLTLKILLKDPGNLFWPDARIAGVTSIDKPKPAWKPYGALAILGAVLALWGAYLLLVGKAPEANRPPMSADSKVGLALIALGYVGIAVAFIKLKYVLTVSVGRKRRA